jgi:hypothetical protein
MSVSEAKRLALAFSDDALNISLAVVGIYRS